MPRQIRVQYLGAIFHVMSRCDRRNEIYLDDVDPHEFLKTLAEAYHKTGLQVTALFSHARSVSTPLSRRETTLLLKEIAARVYLGTSKSAKTTLQRFMQSKRERIELETERKAGI